MKFINGGDLTFEELERIMFLGGLKKKKKKMAQETREDPVKDKSSSRDRSRTPVKERNGENKAKAATVSAEMEFMTKSSMRLQYAVICTQVPPEANELELFKFFTFNGGRTRDVCVLYNGDKPTGTAFVEFQEFNSLRKACSNTNPEVFGKPMIIRHALDVKEEYINSEEFRDSDVTSKRRLRITNLLAVINESDMLGIFKPFGDIEAIDMHRKDGRKICELTFKKEADAQDAVQSMQGVELAGQPLKLQLGDGAVPAAIPVPVPPPAYLMPQQQPIPFIEQTAMPQAQLLVPQPPMTMVMPEMVDAMRDSDFGATRREGSAAQARFELMRKLAMRDMEQGRSNPNSRTIRVSNMFDATKVDLVKDPKFFEEIEEDVIEECKKYGGVIRTHVDQKTSDVTLMFRDFLGRQKAESNLSNRWFGGRRISCTVESDEVWNALPAKIRP